MTETTKLYAVLWLPQPGDEVLDSIWSAQSLAEEYISRMQQPGHFTWREFNLDEAAHD